MLRTEWTSVAGLRALTWTPAEPVAGVVLVDGSGEGACDDWGGWAERVAEMGWSCSPTTGPAAAVRPATS